MSPPSPHKRTAPGRGPSAATAVKFGNHLDSRTPASSQDYIAITKSPSSEIRVALKTWRGEHKLDVREFTATIPSIYMSTASGFTLEVAMIPELIAALRIAQLEHAMKHCWRLGKRGDAFHAAVRSTCPDASLEEYNAAAEKAWAEIGGAR